MLIQNDLIGEKIILRNIKETDCSLTYLQWLNDPSVNMYLEARWNKQTLDGIKEYISYMISSSKDILLAIEFKENRKHIGNIKLGGINVNNSHADVGYFIGDKNYWGGGIATEAVSLITNYALNGMKLHRVFAGVIDGNKASQRVLEKNGYELEGIFRQASYFNERFVDCKYYGKLNRE